ncbi:SUMO ligase siz1, partial [Cladochytrium tenue]
MDPLLGNLKRLKNVQMKDILRKAGERVSGNKADLVLRLEAVFDRLRNEGNLALLNNWLLEVVSTSGNPSPAPSPSSVPAPVPSIPPINGQRGPNGFTPTGAGSVAGTHSFNLAAQAASARTPVLGANGITPSQLHGQSMFGATGNIPGLITPNHAVQRSGLSVPHSAPARFALPGTTAMPTAPQMRRFRDSPFFQPSDVVIMWARDCASGSLQIRFSLNMDQVVRLKSNPSQDRLLLLVGPENGVPIVRNPFPGPGIPIEYPPLDPSHANAPNHCIIAVNSSQVPTRSYGGIKGKPWTAQPLDLTDFIHKSAAATNVIDIRFSPNPVRRILLCVQLFKPTPINEIASSIKLSSTLDQAEVIQQLGLRQSEADEDLVATSQSISLKDPVTQCRISLPARGRSCRHPQCFDLSSYLQLNRTHPTWICPVCSRPATFAELVVDGFSAEILAAAAALPDCDAATIHPDATWALELPEKAIDVEQHNGSAAAASTMKRERSPSMDVVAVGSRPPKKTKDEPPPATDVIDLTLSDDDEPASISAASTASAANHLRATSASSSTSAARPPAPSPASTATPPVQSSVPPARPPASTQTTPTLPPRPQFPTPNIFSSYASPSATPIHNGAVPRGPDAAHNPFMPSSAQLLLWRDGGSASSDPSQNRRRSDAGS